MSAIHRLIPRSANLRYFLIAILAFSIGSATVVEAAPAIDLFRLADGTDATKVAAVDASGNLQVKVNNLPTTQAVSGTVNVGNLPATQPISGTVNIGNSPTVAISPTGNTVQVAGTTHELASGFIQMHPTDTLLFLTGGPIDVSAYRQIRLTVFKCSGVGTIGVSLIGLAQSGLNFTIDSFNVSSCDFVSRSYDVPGTRILVRFENSGADIGAQVGLFGR